MNSEIYNRIENEILKLKDRKFTIFFYVPDAKNNPSGYISYIYQLANCLKNIGYNVKMLYTIENEYSSEELSERYEKNMDIDENRVFVGVKDCFGVNVFDIEHININNIDVEISPSDFLIIPEVFYQVMNQTKKLNCKRIVLLQNYDYILDFMPFGSSLSSFGIKDVIVTNENEEKLLKSIFPNTITKKITPYIPSYFYCEEDEPKKMVINILAKNQNDINKIVKPFYWKYPMFKWVSFRDLRGFSRTDFSDALREGAITIWVDENCNFGYMGIEALKCGNIVIGKIPNNIPEWMLNENGDLSDNGIWFSDINNIHNIIADVVYHWITDDIPSELKEAMKKTNDKYKYSNFTENVVKVFEEYVLDRIKEFEEVKLIAKDENNE